MMPRVRAFELVLSLVTGGRRDAAKETEGRRVSFLANAESRRSKGTHVPFFLSREERGVFRRLGFVPCLSRFLCRRRRRGRGKIHRRRRGFLGVCRGRGGSRGRELFGRQWRRLWVPSQRVKVAVGRLERARGTARGRSRRHGGSRTGSETEGGRRRGRDTVGLSAMG